MLNKIKKILGRTVVTVTMWCIMAQAVFADTTSISEKTADDVSGSIIGLVSSITKPLGAVVIFCAILICGFKIVATANQPRERAEALGAMPYILGGGLLIGGALLVAGFVMGMWDNVQ
ncbi:MAG: hypothetical protein VR67_17410 [Peptococcaceae bacterium BRH_c8a]|nr:MAG: hypothetical protein VR67_17410 [Peptococcaceae bacterium BRH_c8a]